MGQENRATIEIIIATHGRSDLLRTLLESIKATGLPAPKTTIVINGPDIQTESMLGAYPEVSLIKIPTKCTPATARNLALKEVSSDWILFLDDDVIVPEDYFERAHNFLGNHPQAIAFGGSDAPYPGCSRWELSLNITLTSRLATAHTRFRHDKELRENSAKTGEGELTLCNLWIRSEVINKYQLSFNEAYMRNEENVLLHELAKISDEIYRVASLYVSHKRRDHFLAAMKSVAVSGRYRMKSILEAGELGSVLYLFPLFGLLIFLGTLMSAQFEMALALLSLYTLSIFLMSALISLKAKRPDLIPMVFFNHLGINLAYAYGTLKGLFLS